MASKKKFDVKIGKAKILPKDKFDVKIGKAKIIKKGKKNG